MRFKNLAVLMAIPLTFVACSKSGGGSSSGGSGGIVSPGSSISAQFIDSPVKGLKIEKESGNGETGASGKFTCNSGELLTFKINDLEIGKAACGEKIYISDIDSLADLDAVATLIQSLSVPGGGQLDLSAFNAINPSIDLSGVTLTELAIDGEITTLFGDPALTTAGLVAVPLVDAKAHVLDNIPTVAGIDDWVGSYRVTLNGSASNNSEDCWNKVTANVEVEGMAKPGAYKFNVTKYIGHDASVDVSGLCPGSDVADEETHECTNQDISKIMSGTNLNVSSFSTLAYSRDVGDRIACISADRTEYVSVSNVNEDCSLLSNTDENVDLLTGFSKVLNYGYGFQIALTSSKLTLDYQEKNIEIYADEGSFSIGTGTGGNHQANLVSKSYTCNYSYSETLDTGSSPAE